jgi:GTP cyclohydrolase I
MSKSPENTDKKQQIAKAVEQLLHAMDVEISGECAQTPERVAELWADHLLVSQDKAPEDINLTLSPAPNHTPVALVNIGVHLVCPHHLTIAFGTAHICYEPGEHVVGFGALTRLMEHCTQRLCLQEDATAMAANLLQERLQARAVCVVIDARHPCHNIIHTRGHDARAITWAHAGDAEAAQRLEEKLRQEIKGT